jgi:dipicolinate synthase subunit A
MEYADKELRCLLSRVNESATVFCGNGSAVKRYFNGKVLDYSDNEAFLCENAYITAQCALKLTLDNADTVLRDKKALIVGYGRIGKYLAAMLRALGAVVFVYARRKESQLDASFNGCVPVSLNSNVIPELDLVYNTVPEIIIGKDFTDMLSNKSLIFELASPPGGFEDISRVISARGLPGKMLQKSGANAISDFVLRNLS